MLGFIKQDYVSLMECRGGIITLQAGTGLLQTGANVAGSDSLHQQTLTAWPAPEIAKAQFNFT